MVNDPITKIMQDASEIVRYDEVGIPLSIREGLLSAYPNHRALCHWHEDIEWVYIRSGQMNYYMNGKRVLLNTGEALMVNSRQMHYGYSENGQDCDFIRILCHPKIFITNSVLYQSYIAPVLSNPSLEYLHLKPEFPEDAEALQLLPEILRIKKEHPAAYEIEAAALLSLLWCRLLRSHPMMPNEAAAKPKEPDLLVQRDMVSYLQPLQRVHQSRRNCGRRKSLPQQVLSDFPPLSEPESDRFSEPLPPGGELPSFKQYETVDRGNLYCMRLQSSELLFQNLPSYLQLQPPGFPKTHRRENISRSFRKRLIFLPFRMTLRSYRVFC